MGSTSYFVFDTETLPAAAVSLAPPPFVVMGWKRGGTDVQFEHDRERARQLVLDALELGDVIVGYNLAFDFDVLGVVPTRTDALHDGMIADFLLRLATDDCHPATAPARFRSLSEVAGLPKDEAVTLSFHPGVPLTHVQKEYLTNDVLATERVYLKQRGSVPGGEREMNLQVLARMALDHIGRQGIPVDHAERLRQVRIFEHQKREAAEKLHAAGYYRKEGRGPRGGLIKAGTENKLFRGYVEKVAGAHGVAVKHTDTDQVSTASEYLRQFRDDPTIAAWLEYKDCEKLLGMLVAWDKERVHGDVVRCHYTSMVRTGRTASSSPNLQQVPTRRGKGEVKRVFVAPAGREFYEIDFHQLELVCLAHLTQGRMKELINAGKDLHRELGALFFAKAAADVTKDERQLMKCANFGLPGGMGRAKFRQFLRSNGVPDPGDAAVSQLRNTWLALYPEMNEWLTEEAEPSDRILHAIWSGRDDGRYRAYEKAAWQLAQYKVNGRWLPAPIYANLKRGIGSRELETWILNRAVTVKGGRVRRPVTYTEQRNTPFQGLAANLAKEALIALTFMSDTVWTVHAFIHDSVLISCPEGRPDLATVAAHVMLDSAAQWVPDVRTGVEVCGPGNTWFDAKCGNKFEIFREVERV